MRVYALETADGKIIAQPFVAENDDAAKHQVVSIFSSVVFDGVNEYDDLSVVCLFSFDPADARSSLISLHEEIATVGEIFAAAMVKFLAARPTVDFDKLKEEVKDDA